MRCRACTASCYQMAVTASVAGERYSLVCFCWACSVHVLAPICQTAFVAPRPHERELSGHERSTCTAVHALPAATRWQSQLSSLTYFDYTCMEALTRVLQKFPNIFSLNVGEYATCKLKGMVSAWKLLIRSIPRTGLGFFYADSTAGCTTELVKELAAAVQKRRANVPQAPTIDRSRSRAAAPHTAATSANTEPTAATCPRRQLECRQEDQGGRGHLNRIRALQMTR